MLIKAGSNIEPRRAYDYPRDKVTRFESQNRRIVFALAIRAGHSNLFAWVTRDRAMVHDRDEIHTPTYDFAIEHSFQ